MSRKILQFMKLAPQGDAALHERYDVCRFYELDDKEAWLDQHAQSVEAVVTSGHDGISNELAERLPQLGIVAIAGVGYDRVDLSRARERGYRVTNTPGVLTDDVADAGIGLMIMAMRDFQEAGNYLRQGRWAAEGDMPLARKVSGRTYGIFGLGQIGEAIARRLEGFGGSIGYYSRTPKQLPYKAFASLGELAEASDVLFVTAASGPETRKIIDRSIIDKLGPEGFLINVSRGAVVDETALIDALHEGRLGGAGLDVFSTEPNVAEALFALPHVALTPHIGSATLAAREKMASVMLSNLDAFFSGRLLPSPVV